MAFRAGAFAQHVEAAKRLLAELEQHAESARRALGRDNGAEFFAAVEERERLLRELDQVVTALALEHAQALEGEANEFETGPLLAEMAQIAARALESHDRLQSAAVRERDRIGAALQTNNRPDAIASQYAVATSVPAVSSLSVTG